MTKAQLEAKRDELKRQHQQAVANVHACDGALQLVEQLLKEWDTPEPEA